MAKKHTTTATDAGTLLTDTTTADDSSVPGTAPTARTRTRTPSDYLIQRWVEGTGDRVGFWDDLAADDDAVEGFDDTAAAVRYVREKRVVGRLRIVAVKRVFTTSEEQTTTFKLS